jgi:antitoxin component HigA of HigAB toxin-antitoxin module
MIRVSNLPSKHESQYDQAVAEIKRLWGAALDSAEGRDLDNWLTEVELYEDEHHSVGAS